MTVILEYLERVLTVYDITLHYLVKVETLAPPSPLMLPLNILFHTSSAILQLDSGLVTVLKHCGTVM